MSIENKLWDLGLALLKSLSPQASYLPAIYLPLYQKPPLLMARFINISI